MQAERREAQRQAFCRCCDKPLNPGDEMISWYSHRNRGQNIHICLDCAGLIGELANDEG